MFSDFTQKATAHLTWQVHFDPSCISSLSTLVDMLVDAYDATPDDYSQMVFPGRRITLPVVLDDEWNREAIHKYMKTIREKAVYLPSNVEYLARNNGLKGSEHALKKLVSSDWVSISPHARGSLSSTVLLVARNRRRILPRLTFHGTGTFHIFFSAPRADPRYPDRPVLQAGRTEDESFAHIHPQGELLLTLRFFIGCGQ